MERQDCELYIGPRCSPAQTQSTGSEPRAGNSDSGRTFSTRSQEPRLIAYDRTAYIHGLSFCTGDFVIIMDADFSHHVCIIPIFRAVLTHSRSPNLSAIYSVRQQLGAANAVLTSA